MTHPHLIEDARSARAFALGGKARFTIVSKATGKRYTYRFATPKEGNMQHGSMWFVSLLVGPDDYQYIGFTRGMDMRPGAKGNAAHPAYGAINWVLNNLANGNMPGELEFWHEGRCARCARPLTDPASIALGLGPECATK